VALHAYVVENKRVFSLRDADRIRHLLRIGNEAPGKRKYVDEIKPDKPIAILVSRALS
jgi:hypothetical protein